MNFERMITLLILITVTLELASSQNNKNGKGCEACKGNKLCLEKCEEYSKNSKRNSVSAPHCGLSRLEGNVTQRVNRRSNSRRSAKKPSWPWIVSLQYQSAIPSSAERTKNKQRAHFCTGVIISDNFILSSAHCVPKELGDYQIMIGSNSLLESDKSGQLLEVDTIIVPGILYKPWIKRHEKFAIEQGKNDDILLIKTATKMEPKIKGNEFVINSICLPEVSMDLAYKLDWPNKPDGMGKIAGWGYYGEPSIPSSTLMEVQNPFIPNEKANRVLKETRHYFGEQGEYFIYNLTLTEKDVCTMGSSAPGAAIRPPSEFNGDSGSPVTQEVNGRAFVLGISHWISKGQNPISIWARISFYSDWIVQNMKKTFWDF